MFLGQINDADLALSPARPPKMEGGLGVQAHYWHKLALEAGIDVRVARGEEVYSTRVIPTLTHYDLHAYFRYNVYLRKPSAEEQERRQRRFHAGRGANKWQRGSGRDGESETRLGLHGAQCKAFRSSRFTQRYTREGRACVQPFRFKGVAFDDCTGVHRPGRGSEHLMGEWCCLEEDCSASSASWGLCAPVVSMQ